MNKLLAGILIIWTISFAFAQEVVDLVNCENPSEWTGRVILNREYKRSGEFSFETSGPGYPVKTEYKELIPIDVDGMYVMTCYMRSLDSENPASGYMGLYMFDKDKNPIYQNAVEVLADTESELIGRVDEGSDFLLVKKNMNYLTQEHCVVAFNVKDYYLDLPNHDLSPKVKAIEFGGDHLIIRLRSPLKKSYSVGTRIRLHTQWRAPFYWAAEGWMPDKWKKFSVTLNGISDFGTSDKKFWKGTAYVKPFIWFGNWNRKPKAGAKLLIDDIRFVRVGLKD